MRSIALFAAIVALTAVSGLPAEAPSARASFDAGMKAQSDKRWGDAVRDFRAALASDPSAIYVIKALGNTYYLAGDRRGALYYYRQYLSKNPRDSATQKFADNLQAALDDAASRAASPSVGTDTPSGADADAIKGGVDVRLDAGFVVNGGSDIEKLLPDSTVSTAFAPWVGLGLDYAFPSGLTLGLDVYDGQWRSYSISDASGDSLGTLDISAFGFQGTPGWRFRFFDRLLVEPCLGLGYEKSSVTVNFTGDTATTDSASGFTLWPQVRAEWLWDHWGLGGELGYLISNTSAVKDPQGNAILAADGSNWALQNGGLTLGVYGSYHFTPPFQP
jgi:hypothetical protein